MKKIIDNKCVVCDADSFEPLTIFYSRLLPKLFHKIAICINCGHIQVYPMFNDQELKNINEKFFKGLYLQNNKLNTSDNLIKLNKLKKRLTPYINEKMNVLDVGAGEAWAMDYFQKKKCNYFAIEAIPRLADSIVSRGG